MSRIITKKDVKVITQDTRAKAKDQYVEPKRVARKVEKKEENFLTIPIDLNNVFYIGTSDFEKTHEFFKNSQYFLVQYEDTLTYRFTFKVDVKTLRVSKDGEKSTFYLSVNPEKTIMITILDEEGEEYERLLITYEELNDLIIGNTDTENLLTE